MQVIVATVSNRLLISRCTFLSLTRLRQNPLDTRYGLLRTSRSHLRNEQSSRDRFARGFANILTCCVRGSCPSLNWCMRATPRGCYGDGGNSLYRNNSPCNGSKYYYGHRRRQTNVVVKAFFLRIMFLRISFGTIEILNAGDSLLEQLLMNQQIHYR